jgi:hypothetical protein
MCYYILDASQIPHNLLLGGPVQVWWIDDTSAVNFYLPGPPCKYEAGPDGIWATLRCAGFDRDRFHKTVLGPGEFYPRVWRPPVPNPRATEGLTLEWNPSAQHEPNIVAVKRGQLLALTRKLDHVCQTVEPEGDNLKTYGHDIRNLLILACTEAEAHWRGVLVANGATQNRFSTKDYVKLREPMKLEKYAVKNLNYPWLETFKPYEQWSDDSPTCSLEWYDAYNAVKHNREIEFKRATLRCALEAITGCVIMMVAQFGLGEGLGEGSELRSFFCLSSAPDWSPSEFYIPYYGKPVKSMSFGFSITSS